MNLGNPWRLSWESIDSSLRQTNLDLFLEWILLIMSIYVKIPNVWVISSSLRLLGKTATPTPTWPTNITALLRYQPFLQAYLQGKQGWSYDPKGQRAWHNSPNPWRFWSLWIILGYWAFLDIFFTQTNAVSNLWLCSSIINRLYTSRKLTLPPKMWHFIRNCHLPTSIFQGTCYFFQRHWSLKSSTWLTPSQLQLQPIASSFTLFCSSVAACTLTSSEIAAWFQEQKPPNILWTLMFG